MLRCTVAPFVKRSMRYSFDRQKGPDVPSIILSNHNTNIDPALVGMSFSRHMYFLASGHAFRNGLPSKLLNFVFAPIPIDKSRIDASAITDMLRRIKAGASVCLFAEGDRSFNGVTGPIPPATAKLIRTSGADLITFRIDGGYFTCPRWARFRRRGKMSGRFVNRYTAAELKSMTLPQLCSIIERDLYEDAYERQKVSLNRYKGKKLAENIETALYLCPLCNRIGTIHSENERLFCDCGLEAAYSETGFISGEALPFSTVTEWDRWQSEKLVELIDSSGDIPICSDENQTLCIVRNVTQSTLIGVGSMKIHRDALHCAGLMFPIEQITRITVIGRMTLLFALKDGATYEVHSDAPRSALKYKEIFRILTNKNNNESS